MSGMAIAAYDGIADWYETEFLGQIGDTDPLGTTRALRELLGHPARQADRKNRAEGATQGSAQGADQGQSRADGASGKGGARESQSGPSDLCLEIGCGTGVHASTVRDLGWTPIGVDISAGMLRHAVERLPVMRADVERLPFADGSLPAVIAVWVHTDMPAYPAIVREVARVLRPGGLFVHIGTHPCFCGGFADRSDLDAVVIRPGYVDGHWTKASWSDQGIRDKVGASHWPLPALLSMVVEAGLVFEGFTEGGAPAPVMFGWSARKRP
jgi:SAM-dependent methyltransferase